VSVAMELQIPCLKGRQGGRALYLALFENAVFDNVLSSRSAGMEGNTPDASPVAVNDAAKNDSQRPILKKHGDGIAEYILRNPRNEGPNSGYVMGALVMGIDQPGRFVPVSEGSPLGSLHLPVTTRVRSIDGQHRRYGIIKASDVMAELKHDHFSMALCHERGVRARASGREGWLRGRQ
jgi:DGQHR domain-containing protein